MKIAIGAIFRDAFEYITEWLVWHQLTGFDSFYIVDNASSDGSIQLLGVLSDLGTKMKGFTFLKKKLII